MSNAVKIIKYRTPVLLENFKVETSKTFVILSVCQTCMSGLICSTKRARAPYPKHGIKSSFHREAVETRRLRYTNLI